MSIQVELLPDKPVWVDDQTRELGGSFFGEPLVPYDPLPLKWCYDQLIKYPHAVLLDVGANTGCYTLLAAHHPNLEVHAFEPVKVAYRVLVNNIVLNNLTLKVQAFRWAISNYVGVGKLHTLRQMAAIGISLVDGTPAYHKDVITSDVDVMTIDEYCQTRGIIPTFIKIDTEGGEKAVLEGAKATIEKWHPFLLFEYSAENAAQFAYAPSELISMIEKWGYVWTNPEGLDVWAVHREWESIPTLHQMKME